MKRIATITDDPVIKILNHIQQFEDAGIQTPALIMKNYGYWRNNFPLEAIKKAVLTKWPKLTRFLDWYEKHYDPEIHYSPYKNIYLKMEVEKPKSNVEALLCELAGIIEKYKPAA
jgi:hypothetical protein